MRESERQAKLEKEAKILAVILGLAVIVQLIAFGYMFEADPNAATAIILEGFVIAMVLLAASLTIASSIEYGDQHKSDETTGPTDRVEQE